MIWPTFSQLMPMLVSVLGVASFIAYLNRVGATHLLQAIGWMKHKAMEAFQNLKQYWWRRQDQSEAESLRQNFIRLYRRKMRTHRAVNIYCKLIWVAALLVIAPSAWAQVALDTETVTQCGTTGALGACNATTTVTVSHTTGAGSNRAMGVFVKVSCSVGGTALTPSTITYDTTQNLSQTATVTGGSTARHVSLWSLAAGTQPNTGAHNVVVTFPSDVSVSCLVSVTVTVAIFTASGVDQSTTYSSTNTASGNDAGPASVTLASSGASDMGIMAACVGTTFTGTLSSGLTQEFKYDDTATGCSSDMVASSTGGTTVHSANLSGSDTWLIAAAAFKASTGGGGATIIQSQSRIPVPGPRRTQIIMMMVPVFVLILCCISVTSRKRDVVSPPSPVQRTEHLIQK